MSKILTSASIVNSKKNIKAATKSITDKSMIS